MLIDSGRVQNPSSLDAVEVQAALDRHNRLTIQFSDPKAYHAAVFSALDDICQIHDDRLEVRFYGHYGSVFDMRTILRMPHVKRLSVDCLMHADHFEALTDLGNLQWLNFGVFELDKPDILGQLNLSRLRGLTLGDTRKSNIDLAPLAAMTDLRDLFIGGHARRIEAIGHLQALKRLSLNAGNKVSLDFVNNLSELKHLKFILGGREDIAEVDGKGIECLEIVRVRGFSRFDHLPQW